MGRFVNPDNSAFQAALNSRIYVDKTGMIEYMNRVLETTDAYICNSRPRRFGKSYAANMLAAYYSRARGGANVPVDYTPRKYVKKPAGAKPGMVIYSTNRTAYVTPEEALIKTLRPVAP